jgi:hypothetical protein
VLVRRVGAVGQAAVEHAGLLDVTTDFHARLFIL